MHLFEEEYAQGDACDVITRHVHNSEVRASGNIVVQGGGCFYSRLWAGRGVAMQTGAFRGELATVHEGEVALSEVGSRLGAEVHIYITTDGVFRAQKVHPGVKVTIDNRTFAFQTEAQDVQVRLVDGELRVDRGRVAEKSYPRLA